MSETDRAPNVVAIEFWKEFDADNAHPGAQKEVHYVKWGKRGDFQNYSHVIAVSRLQKTMKDADGGTAQDPVWGAIKPAYEAWLAGQETPDSGAALESWPALTKKQVAAFRDQKYRTIEDVAAMSDQNLNQVRMPDVRKLRDMAQAYLKNREGSAQVEAMFATQNEKLAYMEAQLTEARDALARLGSARSPV